MKNSMILNHRNFLSKSFSIILILLIYNNKEFSHFQLSQPFVEIILNYFNFVIAYLERIQLFLVIIVFYRSHF